MCEQQCRDMLGAPLKSLGLTDISGHLTPLAPGVYFRCLLVGYFEGLDSERAIAWRMPSVGLVTVSERRSITRPT